MIRLALLLALALQSPSGIPFAALRDQWASNLHDKQVEASIAQYAPDADFIDPGGHITHGTAALRKLFQTVTATFGSDLTFLSRHVEASGNLAYDTGIYKEVLVTRATGQAQQLTGTYLTIYRQGQNGRWLIAQQAWTAAQPGTSPAARQ